MAYETNPDPIIVEHRTVQPVIERTTIVERDAWYSEPWGIALVIALIAVLGIVVYFVGFNPSNTSPVITNSTTRIEKDVTQPASSSAPVIVNTPPAASTSTPSTTPPVVINNTTAPATPSDKSDKSDDSSKSTGSSDTSSSSSPDSSKGTGDSSTTSGSNSTAGQ